MTECMISQLKRIAVLLAFISCVQFHGADVAEPTVPGPSGKPFSVGRFHMGDLPEAANPAFDDSQWATVAIPHTWSFDVLTAGTRMVLGPAWYRMAFTLAPAPDGRRRFLRFEGALMTADVFLNGHHLGQHRGGYSAFCYEITGIATPGTNVLAVRVTNASDPTIAPPGSHLFTRWGGIYRPITLIEKNATCITPLDFASPGVYLIQKEVTREKAVLMLTAKLSSDLPHDTSRELRFVIRDAGNAVVNEVSRIVQLKAGENVAVSMPCEMEHPHLWSGRADPYLYSVTAELRDQGQIVDTVVQPLGLRYFRVDPAEGFFLNGEYVNLHGVSRHQEWEQYGSALGDEQHWQDFDMICELGSNSIRLAHYQQAETMYRLADERGLVVWAEIPLTGWPNNKMPDSAELIKNCEQQLTELIRQNFNHPSICFWGLYNETDVALGVLRTLNALAKTEDPSRLTTGAQCLPMKPDRDSVTDVVSWNKYPYWYSSSASVAVWRKGLLGTNPQLCLGLSEYGAGGCVDQHALNPQHPDPGKGRFFPEEYQSEVHEKVWKDIRNCHPLWCKYVWNMFDFTWPIVHRGNRDFMNDKGLVTFDRKVKKDAFYFYKANWSDDPVLYITSRRFTRREVASTYVKVYANTGEVKLTVNGRSLGAVLPDDLHIAEWRDITLQLGNNTIQVRASKDGKEYGDQCEWSYIPNEKNTDH